MHPSHVHSQAKRDEAQSEDEDRRICKEQADRAHTNKMGNDPPLPAIQLTTFLFMAASVVLFHCGPLCLPSQKLYSSNARRTLQPAKMSGNG